MFRHVDVTWSLKRAVSRQTAVTMSLLATVLVFAACGGEDGDAPGNVTAVSGEATGTTRPRDPGTEATTPSVTPGSAPPAVESPSVPATEPSTRAAGEEYPYVPEGSVDTADKRIKVTVSEGDVYIRNGGTVMLAGGFAAEIYVDPYPPSTLREWVDIYLTKDGEPFDEASIDVEYDMLAMVHGPFWGAAEKLGGGHYLVTLDYIMFGPWDQALTIHDGLESIRLPLVLVAYP